MTNESGVPLLVLFGPTNPVRTGPVFAAPVRVLQPAGCPPTGGGALAALSPETVVSALRELTGADPPDRPDEANVPGGGGLHDELLGALADLPPRQRSVLVLRYFLDLPEAEVAAALKCSLGTVKSTASRGLARLEQTLRPTHDTRRVAS